MPRRTPINVLAFKGSLKKDPQRYRERANEPEVKAKFPKDPPARLTTAEKAAWRQVKGLVPHGVLTGADVLVVEMSAVLLAEIRDGGMKAGMITQLRILLGSLGLSPSDRARLSVTKGNAGKFDDL